MEGKSCGMACGWAPRTIAGHGRRGLLLVVLILSVAACGGTEASMQWRSLKGPRAGFVITLARDPNDEQTLYAGMLGGGLLRSTDGGKHWQSIDDQPTPRSLLADSDSPDYALDVRSIAPEPGGQIHVASTGAGVYRRTAKNQWDELNRGLPSLDTYVVTLGGDDAQFLYLGSRNGVWVRTLPTKPGDAWQRLDPWTGRGSEHIQALYASQDPTPRLYAGTQSGFYYSVNGGEDWLPAERGLDAEDVVIALAVDPGNIDHLVISTYDDRAIHVSTDGGRTWEESDQPFESVVQAIIFSATERDRLYAVTYDGTLHSSLDGGLTWQEEGGPGPSVVSLLETGGGRLLAGTDGQDIWYREPGGEWQSAYVSSSLLTVLSLLWHDNTLYAGTSCCGVFRHSDADGWQAWNKGLPLQARLVTALAADGETDRLFAATHGAGVYVRPSKAEKWESAGEGLQAGEVHSLQYVLSDSGGVLLAGTTGGLYMLQDGKWEYLDRPQTDIQYAPGNNHLFARTMEGQVWESSDGGASWQIDNQAPRDVVQLAYATGKGHDWTLFALTRSQGLYYRTLDEHWQQADMESTPDGEVSIWGYPGLADGYLQVHVDTTGSSAVPWSNATFERQDSVERASFDSLQAGILVIEAASRGQTLYAGTANEGVYDAEVDVFDTPLQQAWPYVVGGILLLVSVTSVAAYAISRRSGRKREGAEVPPKKQVWKAARRQDSARTAAAPVGHPVERGEEPAALPPLASDTATLRAYLQRLDAVEIEGLCLDHFPSVYDKFGSGQRRDEMINLLLDHCRRQPEEAARLVTLLA